MSPLGEVSLGDFLDFFTTTLACLINVPPPPLIRNFQKNPKNWLNFDEKNKFYRKQKSSHENRMLEINELIILHIFHTFLYPR